MKDQIERPQPSTNIMSMPNQIKRDDFISLYNYQNQIRDLNHTNKEIQKKQFDFNINKQKANVTIQYDTYDQVRQQQHQFQQQQHQQQHQQPLKLLEPQIKQHKPSKSIGVTCKNFMMIVFLEKRRQQSQSMPRHQPSASIVNTQAQPLINLHIQNAKLANQLRPQIYNSKKRTQQPDNYQGQARHQVNSGQQSAPLKSRSKSKNRQKSVQNYHNLNNKNKQSLIGNTAKEILNQSSNYNQKKNPKNNQFLFSFDNKENESINYNDFSPSRIVGKPEARINNFLDSDSSQGSPELAHDQFIAQKLEKSYFMDKSALLKHLSPDKSSHHNKSRINKSSIVNYSNFMPQQVMSDRDLKSSQNNNINNYKSNGSTIFHNQGINESSFNNQINQSILQLKIKRSGTLGSSGNNKLFLKGVDKLIKENLKRNKTKEQEEISKRYMEEFKQKLKKVELTQRNQQVRKINASKIMYNHQHKNSMIQNKINITRIGYKKQRSRSCMNKTDNIFGQGAGNGPRSRERLPQNKFEQFQQPLEIKKEKKREKSFVLELKELQKQVDGEIRREIMEGKIDIQPTSANNKKSNLSTINAKKEQAQQRTRKDILNISAFEQALQNAKRSKQDLNGDESNKNLSKPRRKSKSKEGNKSISQNIKKFMEKKKNAHLQLKSLEQTIENQKNSKIKENLKSLHQFAKQHFRHQSYNFYPKKNNAGLINMHNLESDSSKALPLKKLKPQFFKTKQKKKSSDKVSKKVFDFKGDTIFDHDQKDHIDDDQSIHRDEADISQEFYEDYQRVIRSQKNKKRRQNAGDQSSSAEHSPLRNKSSSKKQKRIKQVYQSQLQNELEQSLILNQKARYSQNDSNIISIDQQQYQSMKNDIAQMPSVVQEKGASLIPPQSDIATLERNHMDRSQNRHFDSNEKKRFTDNRRSQDSGVVSSKSPKLSEQKQKMRLLMSRYGHNLSHSQINAPQADKKLLIKLHSAAITIQQQIRDYLQRKGFYYLGSSNSQSNMYIDSEEDQNNYNYDLSDQKSIQKQLVAQTSPLRVKSKYQQQQYYQKVPQHFENQQKQNKFYSADSSDVEKVIVCSVITTGRADNDESLQNTQKYIPLRQKSVAPIPQQKSQPQVKPQLQFIAQTQPQLHQQQFQQNQFERPQPQVPNKISSASSSAQSGFNTVIKTHQIPLQQRLQSESLHESLDISQQSSSSQRKKIVPSLDFGKLKPKEESKEQVAPIIHKQEEEYKTEQPGSNTARSMFERHSFQDFSQKVHSGEPFNVNNYPEMLKMREEAIKYKEIEEQKILQKMVKTKQMSPRTYDIKRKELESWVSKEKEEVKKTKRVFEEQWQKTTQIIEQTKKNHDLMKKMFNDNPSTQSNAHNHHINQIYKTNDSIPSEHTMQNIQQSHRQSSRRDTTHLLDMIDDYPKQDSTMKQKEDLQMELLKKQYQAEQQKKEQERQRQLDEERIKKEQERKKDMDMLKELERQREEERQKQLIEQERKIKEENERQKKEAERKRLIDFEKEKERLKLEEAERQRKLLEEKKQKELQEKLLEEKRQKELQEQQRKEREEQQRLRDLEIQRKQEEEKKQREALAQKKLEEELKKKQDDDERMKREQEEQKRKADQEEALRIQKQKELDAQKKKELEEQQRKIEEQARLKKEKEDQEKQRQLEFMRELEEIEKAKKAQAEKDKKLKEERDREIEREKLERQRQESEENERMMQEFNEESDRYADSSDKDDAFQRNFNDSSDNEMFMNQRENNLLDNILHEPKRGKEVLESQEDEKIQNDSNLHDISRHHHHRNTDELPRDEEPRGLSRTRSSQYLNENKFEDDMNDMLQVSRDNLQELEQSETRVQDQTNLNDESMDEELLAEQLLRNQEQKNQALGNLVLNDSFFSKNFDDQRPEDLINLFHKQLDDGTLDQTNEISKTLINTSAEKIFVQDGGEETKDESGVIEPKFKFDDKKNQRLSQEMRNQIPVEEEEHINPGMPVSPVSQDGNDIRIQTGAQSLESTLSDGNEFRNAIQEAQRQDAQVSASDFDQNVERITDDIFRQLLAEMKVELDLLLLTDPRRMLREEANSNQFLSESGRFLIFERRGIKTDLFAIEHYVEEVLEEILKDRERFNQSISQPISKNANEVLNQLQNSEIGSYEHFDVNYPQVLPLDLYLKLEKRRKENREIQNPQENNQSNGDRNNQDRNFLAECEHIHNKVLFDCINDSLLQFKPYGREGMPLPWSRQNRRLKPIEEFTTEEMFEIVKHDLFRWAIMQAGTLPRRDFVFNNLFDDELFAEIREKKLATLLAREMIENEPKWLNYEFEEAQVKIDIGDMILEQLVTETITILRQNQGLAE